MDQQTPAEDHSPAEDPLARRRMPPTATSGYPGRLPVPPPEGFLLPVAEPADLPPVANHPFASPTRVPAPPGRGASELADLPPVQDSARGDFSNLEDELLGEMDERTVLATRRQRSASLLLPDGKKVPLVSDTVVIGRKLSPEQYGLGVQLIIVHDPTKTVSKVHARLTRNGDGWSIEDLGSTNGIYLVDAQGRETELLAPGHLTGKFILGDAEFALETGA